MADLRETTTRWDVSAAVLVLANTTPLFGVLFLHWQVLPLLVLYWFENVIVGVINVPRILLAHADVAEARAPSHTMRPGGLAEQGARYQAEERARLSPALGLFLKLLAALFFCCHWGLFTLSHGAFVFQVFGGKDFALWDVVPNAIAVIARAGLGFAALSMAVSHTVSFFANYVRGGEYRRARVQDVMFQPYRRLLIMHATLLAGGLLAWALGSPVYGLITLVAIKTGVDLAAHRAERRRLGGASVPAPSVLAPACR